MKFTVSAAQPDQLDEILALLPRLADFEIPERRRPTELWHGDAELARKWASGELEESVFEVALNEESRVIGVAFATFRPEALSQVPAAHLEVLALDKSAEGHGVARALLNSVEARVKRQGARCLTLNVFMKNERARGFYRHLGFDEELLRCIKELE